MMINQKNNRALEPTLIPQDAIEPQSDVFSNRYSTSATTTASAAAAFESDRQDPPIIGRERRLTMHEKFWLSLNTVGHLPLSNLDDRNSPLSQFQYFLRSSCLSLHFATPVDINEGSGTSVKPPTQIGQVGFKCRFCKDKDSYYWRTFPASIKDIPHDMLTLADKHLKTCKHMFPQHRRIFDYLYCQPGATVINPERYEFWCSNANTVFKMYNSVGGGFMFCPPEVHSMTECRVVRQAHVLDEY